LTYESTAAQAAVKILAGQELGIGPTSAMNDIHVIEGKTEVGAHLIAAAIRSSRKYDYRILQLTNELCCIRFFLLNKDGALGEHLGDSTFTIKDAQTAGLMGRAQMYAKYPRNMLFARALSNGQAWYTPDIFAYRVYTPGEVGPPQIPMDPEKAQFSVEETEIKDALALEVQVTEQAQTEPVAESQPVADPEFDADAEIGSDFYRFLKTCKTLKDEIGELHYYRTLATLGLAKCNQVGKTDAAMMKKVYGRLKSIPESELLGPPIEPEDWQNTQLRMFRQWFAGINMDKKGEDILAEITMEVYGDGEGIPAENQALEVVKRMAEAWFAWKDKGQA
jgi:hypothetical protein